VNFDKAWSRTNKTNRDRFFPLVSCAYTWSSRVKLPRGHRARVPAKRRPPPAGLVRPYRRPGLRGVRTAVLWPDRQTQRCHSGSTTLPPGRANRLPGELTQFFQRRDHRRPPPFPRAATAEPTATTATIAFSAITGFE